MLKLVILAVFICSAVSLPVPQDIFARPGTWEARNSYKINGGRGQVHEEYGQVDNGNAKARHFKTEYKSNSNGGDGIQMDANSVDPLRDSIKMSMQTAKMIRDEVENLSKNYYRVPQYGRNFGYNGSGISVSAQSADGRSRAQASATRHSSKPGSNYGYNGDGISVSQQSPDGRFRAQASAVRY